MRAFLKLAAFFISTTAFAQPSAPVVDVDTYGTYVEFYWYSLTPDVNYRFYYAPYPGADPISSVDMGPNISLEGELAEGSAFYIAVTAYNDEGESAFSNIEYFIIGGENSTDQNNFGANLSCPAGGAQQLSAGWEAVDIFNDIWQFSYDGEPDNDSVFKFCRDGSFLADGEIHDDGDGGTWSIDPQDGALLIDFDSEEYSDREELFLQVSTSFARMCSTIVLNSDLNRVCYSQEYETEEYSTILFTKTTPPEDENGGIPLFSLDGQWQKVAGEHIVDCDTAAGSCITLVNGSTVGSVVPDAPSRVGMDWFRNIVQGEPGIFLGDERWIRHNEGQFEEFFYLPGAIEITSPDFFTITGNINSGLELLGLGNDSSNITTYSRVGATGAFEATKTWTADNKYEPYVFRVNQQLCYTVEHTGDMPMVVIFPSENAVIARLGANSTRELCLEEGRYMLVADLENEVLDLPTSTSFIPPDFDETFPPIQTSEFGSGELNEAECLYGYASYCPADVYCVMGTTCLNPTLNGTWRRLDGRTVECDLDEGRCDFVRFGDVYPEINKLPNIINQPMIKSISETDEDNAYTVQHRHVQSDTFTDEFISFSWELHNLNFNPPDEFTTGSGTYTRVD